MLSGWYLFDSPLTFFLESFTGRVWEAVLIGAAPVERLPTCPPHPTVFSLLSCPSASGKLRTTFPRFLGNKGS